MGIIVEGLLGSVGALASSRASAASNRYNAAINDQNARVALENANIASEAGAEQAYITSQGTRAQVGSIKANQAASGVDVNSGSAVDVQVSARQLGKFDAMTVRSNATKEAFGYVNQADNYKAQAQLDRAEARADIASGWLNAGTTLLGATNKAASSFLSLQSAGALGTG